MIECDFNYIAENLETDTTQAKLVIESTAAKFSSAAALREFATDPLDYDAFIIILETVLRYNATSEFSQESLVRWSTAKELSKFLLRNGNDRKLHIPLIWLLDTFQDWNNCCITQIHNRTSTQVTNLSPKQSEIYDTLFPSDTLCQWYEEFMNCSVEDAFGARIRLAASISLGYLKMAIGKIDEALIIIEDITYDADTIFDPDEKCYYRFLNLMGYLYKSEIDEVLTLIEAIQQSKGHSVSGRPRCKLSAPEDRVRKALQKKLYSLVQLFTSSTDTTITRKHFPPHLSSAHDLKQVQSVINNILALTKITEIAEIYQSLKIEKLEEFSGLDRGTIISTISQTSRVSFDGENVAMNGETQKAQPQCSIGQLTRETKNLLLTIRTLNKARTTKS